MRNGAFIRVSADGHDAMGIQGKQAGRRDKVNAVGCGGCHGLPAGSQQHGGRCCGAPFWMASAYSHTSYLRAFSRGLSAEGKSSRLLGTSSKL